MMDVLDQLSQAAKDAIDAAYQTAYDAAIAPHLPVPTDQQIRDAQQAGNQARQDEAVSRVTQELLS